MFNSVRDLAPDMPFVFVTTYPPLSRLTELLRSERNVQVVYKGRPEGGFLPALRSAFADADGRKLNV
jgi:hypothetical protein